MLFSIGEILVDIFIKDGVETALPGGAPFNVSANIHHFNGNTYFYGAVGKDKYGDLLLNYIKDIKIPAKIDVLTSRHTSEAKVTLTNGERTFAFNRDQGADYILNLKIFDEIDRANIIHIGSLMLSYEEGKKYFYECATKAHALGAKISFDVNYRDDIFESPEEAFKTFKDAIKVADILKFTEEELLLLTNEKDIEVSIRKILADNQIAVVTLGKDGSIFVSRDKYIHVPSKPIKPIDTTGAGDAFYSYFLYSLDKGLDINNDEEIKSTLKIANAVGALATQKYGAIGVAPSEKEALEFLK